MTGTVRLPPGRRDHEPRGATMPINPDAVGSVGEPTEISWTSKQSLIYALGIGAGVADPTGFELEFTTENSDGVTQRAFPTQGVVMGGGGTPDFGSFNPVFLLHAEQAITCHREIPATGTGIATGRVGNIWDKGKAALVYLETDVTDPEGEPLWSTSAGLFLGGEGGWGGERGPSNDWEAPPGTPTTWSPTQLAPTRPSSTGSVATATHCTPIRRSRRLPASTRQYSTDCVPMGLPAAPSCTPPAAQILHASPECLGGSSPQSPPARYSRSTPGRSTMPPCCSRPGSATGWCSTPA